MERIRARQDADGHLRPAIGSVWPVPDGSDGDITSNDHNGSMVCKGTAGKPKGSGVL